MERWLQSVWYGDGAAGWVLRPLAGLYALATAVRRRAFRAGWARSIHIGRPVIVVGNLTVGGTGKTPLVLWLVEQLRADGHRVAVISRGYGRAGHEVRCVTPDSTPELSGDEPLLLAHRSGVPVIVGRDRVAAARQAVELGATVVIADDGLQHLRLARDVEIVVVDGARRFGNGRLLPAGPLREPIRRLATVDFVVVNGPEAGDGVGGAAPSSARPALPFVNPDRVFPMWLEPAKLQPVVGSEPARSLASFRGERVHGVAGIGHPQRFFDLLRSAGLDVIPHAFPDHHAFVGADFVFGDARPVVMTEKDAVKCRRLGLEAAWYLPVCAAVDGAGRLLAGINVALARRAGRPEGRKREA